MSSSAWINETAFSERGLILHLNGFGWLPCDQSRGLEKGHYFYLMVPVVLSCTGSMTTPFSTHLVISKTANDSALEMKTETSARCIPVAGSECTNNLVKIANLDKYYFVTHDYGTFKNLSNPK